eukprot:gene7995-8817_t
MNNKNRDEDEEDYSDGEFQGLFRVRDSEEEIFYFDSIVLNPSSSSQPNNHHQSHLEDGLHVDFVYRFCHDHKFTANLFIANAGVDLSLSIYRTLFSIGMTILPWYWMGFASKKVVISDAIAELAQLDEHILSYWEDVYVHILAEFVYVNKLSFHRVELNCSFPHPSSSSSSSSSSCVPFPDGERLGIVGLSLIPTSSNLVPLGGGKDSLVVWHLVSQSMQSTNKPVLVYVSDGFEEYNLNYRLEEIVQQTKCRKVIVNHDFHYQDLGQVCRSYLTPCGHPWAGLVLFDCLLVSLCMSPSDSRIISFGHEKSADEGNNLFLPNTTIEVNHQYDKSSPYMRLSQTYIEDFITKDVTLSTPLSHIYEVEIARIFCEEEQLRAFHKLFLSCNEPIQGSQWCLACDKCAFIYLLLSAHCPPAYLQQLFTRNMFDDRSLTDKFLNLLGKGGMKPFDCVGTTEEASLAVLLAAHQHYCNSITNLPPVLEAMCRYCKLPSMEDRTFWDAIKRDELIAKHAH